MSEEALYNKIDKFCNETDWKKYPTYEHALEEFVKGIVAEETKELQEELRLEKIENKDLIERVNELEKENSELKTDNVEWEKASDKWKSLYELTNNQLTTAKEIISEYINILKGDTKNWKKTQEKAEQFINKE